MSHVPSAAPALPCKVAVGRLRTRLMVPDGSPAPVIRPAAPRSTSIWSYSAMSPVLCGVAVVVITSVVGTPSNW